jgi:hypothetical protein
MKIEYFSLTEAIDLFERYKVKYFRNHTGELLEVLNNYNFERYEIEYFHPSTNESLGVVKRSNYDKESIELGRYNYKTEITYDLVAFIKDETLPLYGKKVLPHNNIEKKENDVWEELMDGRGLFEEEYSLVPAEMLPLSSRYHCNSMLETLPTFSNYYYCNNYNYERSYNPAGNYDALRSKLTGENKYVMLSIKYDDLQSLISKLYPAE